MAKMSLTCTHKSFLGQLLFADLVYKFKTGLQRTFSLCRPVFAYNLLFFDLHGCILASGGSGVTFFSLPDPKSISFRVQQTIFSFPDPRTALFLSHTHENKVPAGLE